MLMKTLLAFTGAIALSACAAAKPVQATKLTFDSADVGYTQIVMRASETQRNEQASVITFEDLNPDQGSKLTKGVFRLRSAATVASARGYRYFVILQTASDDDAYMIGLLPARDTDFGERFGDRFASLSRDGILDAQQLGPLDVR